MLLVVAAVILLLSTRSWKNVMPAAGSAIKPHSATDEPGRNMSLSDSLTPNEAPPVRPNLGEAQRKTGEHAAAVKDALSETE